MSMTYYPYDDPEYKEIAPFFYEIAYEACAVCGTVFDLVEADGMWVCEECGSLRPWKEDEE